MVGRSFGGRTSRAGMLPMVAWDGSVGGLTRDGSHLVLASPFGARAATRFLLLDAGSFKILARARLRGAWAFDALSPDASSMYLIHFIDWGTARQSYEVQIGRATV